MVIKKKFQRIRVYLMIAIASALLLTIAGCFGGASDSTGNDVSADDNDVNDTTSESGISISAAQLSEHSSTDSCWIAVSGEVYDITDFISRHPGGSVIAIGCGIDATALYETRPMGSGTPHSANARDMLEEYHIGSLE